MKQKKREAKTLRRAQKLQADGWICIPPMGLPGTSVQAAQDALPARDAIERLWPGGVMTHWQITLIEHLYSRYWPIKHN